MRTELTAAFVKVAPAETGKDRTVYWDEDLPGFGLVVTANGARSYCVQYRAAGQSRRMSIDFGRKQKSAWAKLPRAATRWKNDGKRRPRRKPL